MFSSSSQVFLNFIYISHKNKFEALNFEKIKRQQNFFFNFYFGKINLNMSIFNQKCRSIFQFLHKSCHNPF